MTLLFCIATAINLLALTATAVLGYGVSNGRAWSAQHQLCGVLATIVCVGVHCVVFTYFIATAKWVQHAVSVKGLDPSLISPTRSFRAAAFPAALLAMAIVFVTAMLGAARDNGLIARGPHHVLAVAAMATNIVVAAIEYRAIARNGRLIDRVLAEVASKDSSPSAAEAPVDRRAMIG